MGILNNVAIQWLIRRIPDVGGWVTFVVSIYIAMPEPQKEAVNAILQGRGGGLTVTALIGLLAFLYGQVISFRATVKPQAVVEENGKLVTNTLSPAKESEVKEAVRNVSSKKTLWDIIKGQ